MKRLFLLQILFTGLLISGCSSDDDGPGAEPEVPVVESATIDVESGGPNQPNQVYIDLSTSSTTVVRRDIWELGFYTGSQNRVFLNASILVTAAELSEFTDIDAVNSSTVFEAAIQLKSLVNPQTGQIADVTVNNTEELKAGLPLGYSMYGDLENGIFFTDSKEGGLNGTTIAEVSTTDADNKVYVVSAGSEIPTETPNPGKIETTGNHRGFYKIRVLAAGNDYILQYAELDAENHQEVVISKDDTYNIKAFSLIDGAEVNVEPVKEEWDINFISVYSYYGNFGGSVAGVTFSDYTLHNTLGDVGLYMVLTHETEGEETAETGAPSFEEFTKDDVVESEFVYDDRAVVGSAWRETAGFGGSTNRVKDDRYYIVKDAAGNYFKLQFTAFMSAGGERGYPQFKYELLE